MQKARMGIALLLGGLLGACAPSAEVQPVELIIQGMTYTPAAVEVRAGAPVEIRLTNADSLEHDFSILEIPVVSVSEADSMSAEHQMEMGDAMDAPDLHVAAAPGASNVLTFTPSKPGGYEFYCTVPGHREAGMRGVLTVAAP